jgi:hypothetical protein
MRAIICLLLSAGLLMIFVESGEAANGRTKQTRRKHVRLSLTVYRGPWVGLDHCCWQLVQRHMGCNFALTEPIFMDLALKTQFAPIAGALA